MAFEPGNVQEIRINDGYASLIMADYPNTKRGDSTPKSRRKTITVDTYVQKLLLNNLNQSAAMLPPNCRYMESFQNGVIALIEEPPAFRTIAVDMSQAKVLDRLQASGKLEEYGYDYNEELNRERPYMFSLAIPFTVFILTFSPSMEVTSGQVYFRNKQISGFGDYLLKAPLSNISDNSYICFGDKIYTKNKSIYSGVQTAQEIYWSTIFNTDYLYNVHAYAGTAGLCDYFTWQYMSATNPMFIYNADWLKMPFTLGDRLETTVQHQRLTSAHQNPYTTLRNAFTTPTPTGKVVKPTKRAHKKVALYYDMAQGYYMTDKVCVNVGDIFELKNKKQVHIDNFIGFLEKSEPHIVRVNINGKLSNMKMTNAVKKFIAKQVEAYVTESKIDIDGKTVKKNQILVFKNTIGNEVYKKVKYIRKAVDGQMELHIGAEYYLADQIKDFELFDKNNIKIYGQEIKSGDEFILLRSTEHNIPMFGGARVKFDDVIIDHRDRLSYKFIDQNKHNLGYVYNILSTNLQKSRLIKPDDISTISGTFRMGRMLLYNSARDSEVWKTPYGYIKDSIASIDRPNFARIKQDILKDDELLVQSYDLDISFKIGDKVVVSDWDTPLNMLSIKMIQGFKVDDYNSIISFILIDKHGNLSEHVYIKGTVINTGTIRRVSNVYNKIKVGTKITANTAGIPCFPKKDTNIIVAFITDTGIDDPLVLCSNCCTLWFSDMIENFDRVTMRARKWNDLAHADVDLSKINYQPGDLVNGMRDFKTDRGFILFKEDAKYGSSQMKAHNLDYYNQYNEFYYVDRRFMRELKFDSIISPRLTASKVFSEESKPGFSNFHGVYTIVSESLSQFHFPLKYGRMIDVSDFYK